MIKAIACAALALFASMADAADGVWKDLSKPARIPLEPGEGWWGGAWDLGGDMPITGEKRYVMDLREGCKFQGNASLFVSDRGRWIWSDDPCAFTFENGVVTVELTRGEVRWGKAGETLKDACRYVSRTFQKPSGKHPDLSFFATPQYCTWIELGYSQTQAAIKKYVRDIKANGFPPGVIMIDDTWQTDYGVWDFDARVFPDPKKLCDDLHRDGFKVMLWACSFVSPDSREYRELQAKEGVLMAADRSLDFEGHPNTVLYNWWNGWSGVIDWTSPAGVKWASDVFQGLCRRYGVDGFKFDATNPRYFSMPNRLAHAKDASAADLSHAFAEFGEQFPMPSAQCWRQGGRAIVVRLTDKGHTWKEAHRCVSDMAVAGLMGCPFVLPDMVGGGLLSSFAPGKKLDQDLFVRSAQSQALSPMIQFSAAPWRVLDAEHLAAVKAAVALRAKFAPKFRRLAEEAGRTGEPILRPLEYAFPRQGYREVKDEFLMGDDLLVVPQLAPGTRREALIPPGEWTADDGTVVQGPAKVALDVPLSRIPHFLRTHELVPPGPHPRLFANAAEFASVRRRLETTELGRLGLGRLRYEADAMLKQPVSERTLVGIRLLQVSRVVLDRIGKLSLAWRLTGERKYADRAIAEARAAAAFVDWNPKHFLDAAEMTLAMALARDWLDDVLSADDRRLFTEAILRKGLTTGDGTTLASGWWVRGKNNWNQVCNGSLAAGAEAIRDEYPSVASRLLNRARQNLPIAADAYAGGNFPEGPASYWEYATDYHALALATLSRAFADGAPELFAAEGLAEQADYPNLMTGPTGLFFNYSDAGVTSVTSRHLMMAPWFLAKAFDRRDALLEHDLPLFREYCRGREPIEVTYRSFTRMFPFVLLWMDDPQEGSVKRAVPLCRALGGHNPVAVLRSGTSRNDWYVGIKAGTTAASHSHLDEGTFVLDAGGVRWASELGCEDYGRIEKEIGNEIWNSSQKSRRWSIYRYATRGHNTLQIGGSDLSVTGLVTVAVSSPDLPSVATTDLSVLYPQARRVVRTFRLDTDGLRVADTLEGLAPGTPVTWRLHTPAHAEASGGTVRLTADGRTMTLTAAPAGLRWQLRDLTTMPDKIDSPNPGITCLTLAGTAGADGNCAFDVCFTLDETK